MMAFVIVSCKEDSESLGAGVLHLENQNTYHLRFYNLPEPSAKEAFSVNLFNDSERVGVQTSLRPPMDSVKFNPLYLVPQQSVLVLQVVKTSGSWAQVVTDKNNGLLHWIKHNDLVVEPWKDFILSTYNIKPLSQNSNPLLDQPGKQGHVLLENLNSTCLSPISVQGDWMKVRNTPGECDNDSNIQTPFEGFIRWKEQGHLLISFSL